MSSRASQFLAVVLFAGPLLFSCSRQGSAPPPAPDASTPSMPLPGTSTPQTPAPAPDRSEDDTDPFSAFVRQCYLVDPEINPIGAPKSREKGIRMVVRGKVRNNTQRIIFRAGVFSKLVVNFGKNAKFEKHSGGLGFDPPVTSTNPWRPGTWRNFKIIGRAFDPIYREFEPQTITGILSLEAKDPLGFQFSGEIERMRPKWNTLFGAVVDARLKMLRDLSVKQGPYGYRTSLKSGAMVRVVAQQGASFLVEKDDHLAGWLAEEDLYIHQYETLYPDNPARTLPMMATYEGYYQFTVSDYRFHNEVSGLPKSPGGYMAFLVTVKSLAERSNLPVRPKFFWIDQGSGRQSTAINKVKEIEGALPSTEQLPPGAQVGGWLYFPRHQDGWPFALVFQPGPTKKPVHVLLLPVMGREGAMRSPGSRAP